MGSMKVDRSSKEFDLKSELSTLVNQNIIPPRIAERLEQKLIQKKVKINKEQLRTLVYKIRDVLTEKIISERKQETSLGEASWDKSDTDMQKLVEIIEKLEERVTNIEGGKTPYSSDITTDNLKISESAKDWEIDPLKEVPNDPESIIAVSYTHLTLPTN